MRLSLRQLCIQKTSTITTKIASAIRRISRSSGVTPSGRRKVGRRAGRRRRPAAGAAERGPSLRRLLRVRLVVEEVELDDVVVALGHERG